MRDNRGFWLLDFCRLGTVQPLLGRHRPCRYSPRMRHLRTSVPRGLRSRPFSDFPDLSLDIRNFINCYLQSTARNIGGGGGGLYSIELIFDSSLFVASCLRKKILLAIASSAYHRDAVKTSENPYLIIFPSNTNPILRATPNVTKWSVIP